MIEETRPITRLLFCSATPALIAFSVANSLHEGSLVVNDLPALGSPSPDRRAAGDARALEEGVGQQVVVGGDLQAMEVAGFPEVFGRMGVPLLQLVQHELPAVAPARGADFPEPGFRHTLEVGASRPELWAMEDRLPLDELVQDVRYFWVRDQTRFHIAEHLFMAAHSLCDPISPRLKTGKALSTVIVSDDTCR